MGLPEDKGYEEIEHAADWAFQVRGRDLQELFTNAARAMCSMEQGEPEAETTTITRELQVEGVDREGLLVNWLNEILYLEQAKRESYHRFDIIEIDATHLRARVYGAPAENRQGRIKAVTFHNLEVKKTAGGWEATVVADV
ncbi:MAG: archease [Terriglobales bacterium]